MTGSSNVLAQANNPATEAVRDLEFAFLSNKVTQCTDGVASGKSTSLSTNIPQVWRDVINAAAPKYSDVDPRLVASVLWAENKGWPEYKDSDWAESGAGARGPWQFIPQTWMGWDTGIADWSRVNDEAAYGAGAMGTDGDGDGIRNPLNPRDAVEAAFKHHRGSAGKPIADEGYDPSKSPQENYITTVFQRNNENLLSFASKYNGSGAPSGVTLNNFPRAENANYVVTNYWLLASDFQNGYDYGGTYEVVDAATFNNRAGGEGGNPNALTNAATSSCGFTDGSGAYISGDIAGPLDKKWWDEHREWFLGTHHGDPNNAAVDIQVPTGTPVYSMIDGVVLLAPNEGGYGQGVSIQSGDILIAYGHGLDGGQIVKPGDTVKAGQLIMHSASTGNSSGPHLHIDIKANGSKYCPQPLLKGIYEGAPPDILSLPTSGCTNF
ncbi:M23 family metallopeptidase [Candidatus Saccharibacteria bacterium]|nr:M23 family metallopeptidase [Candidatus Saccharibacteria bacterium]